MRSEETAYVFNAPDHLAEAAHHMLVTATKNVNAQCAKSCVSFLIAKSCSLAGVRASIDFNRQPYLGTIEINDETANPMLPSELERFQIAQSGPESPLGECRFGFRLMKELFYLCILSRGVPLPARMLNLVPYNIVEDSNFPDAKPIEPHK